LPREIAIGVGGWMVMSVDPDRLREIVNGANGVALGPPVETLKTRDIIALLMLRKSCAFITEVSSQRKFSTSLLQMKFRSIKRSREKKALSRT
jgi:hypothetical protein